MNDANLQDLETAADGLGQLLNQVVFVGGVTVELYATAKGAPKPRPTFDVDCIVEIASYGDYGEFEEELRQRGFRNDRSEGAPICRWIYKDITVDIMPTTSKALGFSNKWHSEGIGHSFGVTTPGGKKIRLLQSPYFLASKLEAVKNRGWKDLKMSPDFEDVVYVVRNRDSLIGEVQEADHVVRTFICQTFSELLARQDIHEAILWSLDPGEPDGTSERVYRLMEDIALVDRRG